MIPVRWNRRSSLEADAGAGMGAPDPRSSRPRRTARHRAGHGAAACLMTELSTEVKRRPTRQMFRSGHQGSSPAEVCDAAELRAEHRMDTHRWCGYSGRDISGTVSSKHTPSFSDARLRIVGVPSTSPNSFRRVTCGSSSLRANGSRECAPNDRLRETITSPRRTIDCFACLAMTMWLEVGATK